MFFFVFFYTSCHCSLEAIDKVHLNFNYCHPNFNYYHPNSNIITQISTLVTPEFQLLSPKFQVLSHEFQLLSPKFQLHNSVEGQINHILDTSDKAILNIIFKLVENSLLWWGRGVGACRTKSISTNYQIPSFHFWMLSSLFNSTIRRFCYQPQMFFFCF